MGYTINVPVDWLYPGARVWIIEPALRTGFDGPYAFANMVKGFSKDGLYFQHEIGMPVYHANFSDISKTVFKTKEEAERALEEMLNG